MRIHGRTFIFNRPYIMGILNVTPDSFSDGGKFAGFDAAVARAFEIQGLGADILDIGGESTRPGSAGVSGEEETERVVPVIREIVKKGIGIPVSIDTCKSQVAQQALEAGAAIINDISGGTFDPLIMECTAKAGAAFIISHIKGTPENMQSEPDYSEKGVVGEVMDYFRERIAAAESSGIDPENIIIDPGIGFGKTLENNLELLEAIPRMRTLGKPVLIGTSRKSMIGKILGSRDVSKRVFGTAATVAISIARGADIVRVHDVAEMKDVAVVAGAMADLKSRKAAE